MAYVPPHRRQQAASNAPAAPPVLKDAPRIPTGGDDLDFLHKHLIQVSTLLASLQKAKEAFENDPQVEQMFRRNRAIGVTPSNADSEKATTKPSSTFANQFHGAMEEVDSSSRGAVSGSVKRFLDLGCAPGGFSRWILEHNPNSMGMGVTLPPEMGGIPMVMEGILEDSSRYRCEYRDVTESPGSIRWSLQPDTKGQSHPEYCDLVIAGSIYRDHETIDPSRDKPPPLRKRSRQLLAYSQLLAALQNLEQGGTLVMVCNMKPQLHNVEMLHLLRNVFGELIPVKPTAVHTIRSSFYLVGLRYDRDAAIAARLMEQLERALKTIDVSDEVTGVQSCLVLEGSEDAIKDKLTDYALSFYQPLWNAQLEAIEAKMSRMRRDRQRQEYTRRPFASGDWRSSAQR
ncbi:hypothetical protein HDU85_002311 [Gaertneriomyces sp. JEL0708]|nr:hypothetical protein HDU85_002311 [Gaertneriomyces sp. JEL0708]